MKKLFFILIAPLMLLGACYFFSLIKPMTWNIAIITALFMIACQLLISQTAPKKIYTSCTFQTWLVGFTLGHCTENHLWVRTIFWGAISLYALWVLLTAKQHEQLSKHP